MSELLRPILRFKQDDGSDFPDWDSVLFEETFKKFPTKKYQIKSQDILPFGEFPVIDQGQKNIAGYFNDKSKVFSEQDVIVFGDHTTIIKFVDFDFIIGADGTVILTNKKDDNLKFLYYYLMQNNVNQEGYKRHFSILKELNIKIPNINEQNKIASFLSSVDNKIELLTKKHELLEKYKKGLMQKIFSQEIRFKQDDGSDFPDWEESLLEDCIKNIATGLNPRQNFILGEGENYYVTIKNIDKGSIDFSTCELISNEALKLINARSKLKKNDIIISSIGNIGEAYLLKEDPLNWDINESVFKIETSDKLLNYFLFHILSSYGIKKYFYRFQTGSSFTSIKKKSLLRLAFPLPSFKEQEKIASFLSSVDTKIELVQQQIEKTQTFKKGLLQQMLV